ncbi:MAG: hypothetical protein WCK47_02400 [bacterium]|nr:hypothetical protein [Candidatus Sumerlaeota bacterium]
MLNRGQTLNIDVLHCVGFEQEHNETAWQSRFPWTARFLFPIEAEPNTVKDNSTTAVPDWAACYP